LDMAIIGQKYIILNVSTVKIIQNKHIKLLKKFVALITICTILLLSHLTINGLQQLPIGPKLPFLDSK
jgi:hypothetical protein